MLSTKIRNISLNFFPMLFVFLCASPFLLVGCGSGSGKPTYVETVDPSGHPVIETLESAGPERDEVDAAPPREEDIREVGQSDDAMVEVGATAGYVLPDFNRRWGLSRSAYDRAVTQMSIREKLFRNKRYVAIVDFSKHSSWKRLFLFDLHSGRLEKHNVSHGVGSDPKATGYARYFSNEPNSLKSSLGVYKTLTTYQGKHGLQLRIDGLEHTNNNALSRAIVVHGAKYVSDSGRAGRSWGCPALDTAITASVINRIKGGAMLLIWQ